MIDIILGAVIGSLTLIVAAQAFLLHSMMQAMISNTNQNYLALLSKSASEYSMTVKDVNFPNQKLREMEVENELARQAVTLESFQSVPIT